MAVDGVEVDQVREDHASFLRRHQRLDRVHAVGVALGRVRRRYAPPGEQVRDLADRRDLVALRDQPIEQRLADRRHRVIVTIRCALERARQADERPRDHAPQAQALDANVVGRLAPLVELRHGHDAFVRGDLEHAVGGRVDDREAGLHVLGTELVDDRGARRDHVADRLAADARLELLDHLLGKAVREGRERAIEDDAHQLPVPRHRVLARRALRHASESRRRRRHRRAALQRDQPRHAHRGERWNVQGNGGGDVAERVAALVLVQCGIGQFADADAVEHDYDGTRKHSVMLAPPPAGGRQGWCDEK